MDWLILYFKGLAVGLAIAVPVGPVGLLCLQRTLEQGRLIGLASGLGAATADALYGMVAALGLSWIADFLFGIQLWLGVGGGLFLLYIGLATWRRQTTPRVRKPASPNSAVLGRGGGLLAAWASTFLFTLTSPLTILAFAAIFAGLGLVSAAESTGFIAAFFLVAGVFSGSSLWWIAISLLAGLCRKLLSPKRLQLMNRIAGAVLIGMGLAMAIAAVIEHQ